MGNSESQPVRNVDKRTARRDHAPKFKGAITSYRQGIWGAAPKDADIGTDSLFHSANDALRVAVRRRPFFKHELDQGEFDVVSCERRRITVHDCRLHPDCRRLFVDHKCVCSLATPGAKRRVGPEPVREWSTPPPPCHPGPRPPAPPPHPTPHTPLASWRVASRSHSRPLEPRRANASGRFGSIVCTTRRRTRSKSTARASRRSSSAPHAPPTHRPFSCTARRAAARRLRCAPSLRRRRTRSSDASTRRRATT